LARAEKKRKANLESVIAQLEADMFKHMAAAEKCSGSKMSAEVTTANALMSKLCEKKEELASMEKEKEK
jgi:hypothetical protein